MDIQASVYSAENQIVSIVINGQDREFSLGDLQGGNNDFDFGLEYVKGGLAQQNLDWNSPQAIVDAINNLPTFNFNKAN